MTIILDFIIKHLFVSSLCMCARTPLLLLCLYYILDLLGHDVFIIGVKGLNNEYVFVCACMYVCMHVRDVAVISSVYREYACACVAE